MKPLAVMLSEVARIAVRAGLPSDLGAIADIDEYAQTHPERVDFVRTSITRGECFIAELGDEVVGFVVLNYTFFGFGFIPLLVVAQRHRRRGIGHRLVAEVQLRCKSRKLFSSANASNAAALALFARAGFTRSGIIENLDEGDPEVIVFIGSGQA